MSPHPDLAPLLDPLINRNTRLFGFFSALGALGGVGFVLVALLAPSKPDELPIRVGIGLFGLLTLFLSGSFVAWARRQGAAVRRLALQRPTDIVRMEIHRVQKGAMVAWGVHLFDDRRQKVAITVPNEQYARELVGRLVAAGARAA